MSDELDDNIPLDNEDGQEEEQLQDKIPVSGMYRDWFLDYASYVILERAVPAIEDGLKPVQRRILHAMKEMDDGRFNKVANVIGQTMQYHPHGDAAIGDAAINLGQKDLMIETQGNWGDVRTGDSAAAPRYIEARLSKFALEVAFNPDTTEWQLSYDGRKREPVALPMKFPLLLAQGVEGIAVGLSTKILPHNFIELIEASIKILKGKKIEIFPDFPTGGMADVSEYNNGKRGGRVKVRARIESPDKKTLLIKDIPYGTTTGGLIDSILKANDKGKIKIKKVVDNTAAEVEIAIELPSGISPDMTIDALYAFTDCEVSISPNACVIIADKPHFLTVEEILRTNTEQTKELLRRELEIKKHELEEKWHFSSLEKIFIENRIYRDIEEEETWEGVISAIDKGLDPFKKLLLREVTEEDIVKLTEIRIKRISKFDAFKADELIKKLEDELEQVKHDLAHLTEFAIAYYDKLLSKYGKGRERKTELRTFDTIARSQVAVANQKLYINREEGFVGYGLKKDEFVTECSDIDDIIVFLQDGRYQVSKVSEKAFVGKNIIHADVWKRGDDRMIYNAVYFDGKTKRSFVKRFAVPSITRDKEYDVTSGAKNSRVLYFSANPNGEAELINIQLTQGSTARVKNFDFNFAELDIKGRGAKGNTLTKYPVRKVTLKTSGESTLGGLDIWLDDTVGRLNTDDRGEHLGNFMADDRILVIYKDGSYELTSFELSNRYEMQDIHIIKKLEEDDVVSAVHYDAEKKNYYVKRFQIEGNKIGVRNNFIGEEKGSKPIVVTTDKRPNVEVHVEKGKAKTKEVELVNLTDFIDIKGWKALGNRLSMNTVKKVKQLESDPEPEGEDAITTDAPDETSNSPDAEVTENTEVAEKDQEKAPKEEPADKGGQDTTDTKKTPGPKEPEEPKSSESKAVDVGGSVEWEMPKKETKAGPTIEEKPQPKPEPKAKPKPPKKDKDGGSSSGQASLF